MPDQNEIQDHTTKPMNVIEQYKAYIAERTARREAIKGDINVLSLELKSINEELDGEKQNVISMRSLLTATRKRRESTKTPAVKDEQGNVVPKKRGRKSNADKAAEAAAANKA